MKLLAGSGARLIPDTAAAAAYVGIAGIAYVGTNLSPALLGVGYIVGLNIAAFVVVGGRDLLEHRDPDLRGLFRRRQIPAPGGADRRRGRRDGLANAIWSHADPLPRRRRDAHRRRMDTVLAARVDSRPGSGGLACDPPPARHARPPSTIPSRTCR